MRIKQPVIETERLILRLPRLEDAQDIFDGYAQDPEVTRYMIWRPHRSIAETEAYLRAFCDRADDDGSPFLWAINVRGDDTLRGVIELRPAGHKADFGYVLARDHWGRGYMTEALRAVLKFAFELPGMFRVWALCDIDNRASARVMEKAGLEFEGILRRHTIHPNISHEPRDVRCYAMTR